MTIEHYVLRNEHGGAAVDEAPSGVGDRTAFAHQADTGWVIHGDFPMPEPGTPELPS